MRSWVSIVLVACGGLLVFACSGAGPDDPRGGGGSGGTILDCGSLMDPPPGCDDVCPTGSDSECELGTFCLSGVCSAQCNATEGCGGGSSCNTRGRCVPDMNTGGMGGTGGGNACQSITITPTRSTPNVMFLVDQSGSMVDSFGGGQNRWEAAHSAITDIVDSLDAVVRFGLTTYTSQNGDENPPCPRLPTQVDFALDNAGTIGNESVFPSSYPSQDGNDTPTGDSIDALMTIIENGPPPAEGPTIIVLATDGEPDSCECPDSNHPLCDQVPAPTPPRDQAVAAAVNAHAAGVDVFILSVGDQVGASHLQDMANVGVGLAENGSEGDAPYWVGNNPTELESAFSEIIGASISCDIQMDKRFDNVTKACAEGDVRLNGNPLDCPSDWRVKPGADDVIELVDDPMVDDDACDTLKSGDVTFTASFPCGAILVE